MSLSNEETFFNFGILLGLLAGCMVTAILMNALTTPTCRVDQLSIVAEKAQLCVESGLNERNCVIDVTSIECRRSYVK